MMSSSDDHTSEVHHTDERSSKDQYVKNVPKPDFWQRDYQTSTPENVEPLPITLEKVEEKSVCQNAYSCHTSNLYPDPSSPQLVSNATYQYNTVPNKVSTTLLSPSRSTYCSIAAVDSIPPNTRQILTTAAKQSPISDIEMETDPSSQATQNAESPKPMETDLDVGSVMILPSQVMDTCDQPDPEIADKIYTQIASRYTCEMRGCLDEVDSEQLTVCHEQLQKYHEVTVKKLEGEVAEIFKRFGWPPSTQDNQSPPPSKLLNENGQLDIDIFIIQRTETFQELQVAVEQKNGEQLSTLDTFHSQLRVDLDKNMHTWVFQATELHEWDKHESAADFINGRITAKLLKFQLPSRLHLPKALRESQEIQIYMKVLSHCQKCFSSYRNKMEDKFSKEVCFISDSFQTIQEEVWHSTEAEFSCEDITAKKILLSGFDHLKEQYYSRNERIQAFENEVFDGVCPRFENLYTTIMEDLTKGRFYITAKLEELHELVKDEIFANLETTCDFKQYHQDSIKKGMVERLENNLNSQLQQFLTINISKAEKMRLEIKDILVRSRKLYNTRMDKELPTRGPYVENSQLEKFHNTYIKETCEELEADFGRMGVAIPSKEYVTQLKQNISQDWVEIQKLNERLRQKEIKNKPKFEAAEPEKKEKPVENPQLNRKLPPKIAKDQKWNQSSKAATKPTYATKPKIPMPMALPHPVQRKEKQVLQTICVDFGFTLIRVGMMVGDKLQILFKKRPILTLTKAGEILIGTEVTQPGLAELELDLGTILRDPAFTRETYNCFLKGNIIQVRPEVMIALFLSRLKADIEEVVDGVWTTITLSIPLCLTSTQRQGMKDAAGLAGFAQVRIINDTTAAAYCYFKKEKFVHNGTHILVCSVQRHISGLHFDAAVYQLHPQGREIVMLQSCGNLHSSVTKDGSWSIVGFAKNAYSHVSGKTDKICPMLQAMVEGHKKQITTNICINPGPPTEIDSRVKKYGVPLDTSSTKDFVLMGAAFMSSTTPDEQFVTMDKAIYTFFRTSSHPHEKHLAVFDHYQTLQISKDLYKAWPIGLLTRVETKIEIYEESLSQKHYIGELVIPGSSWDGLDCNIPVMMVAFSLGHDGIFTVRDVFYTEARDPSHRNNLKFAWISRNIQTQVEFDQHRNLTLSILDLETKEKFANLKMDLKNLVDLIQPHVLKVKSLVGQSSLKEGIEAAETTLGHAKATVEQLEEKRTFLTMLRTKYLHDFA